MSLSDQLEILELIATGRPLEECLSAISAATMRLLPGTHAAVLVTNDNRTVVERVYSASIPASFREALYGEKIVDPPIGSCGAAIYHGEPMECRDLAADERVPDSWRELCRAHNMRACYSTPIFNSAGETIASLPLFFTEIHSASRRERKIAEFAARIAGIALQRDRSARSLRENEERFRAFVASGSEVVYRMSADWGEMHFLNGSNFIESTNEPNRAWMMKYIHPDDQARVLAAINEAIAHKATFDLEHRVIRVDGTLGWTHSRAIPFLDERGEIVEWFGAAADITSSKEYEAQQQEALHESERVIETLQRAFVPHVLPQTPELSLDALYLPAGVNTPIGGDWYDAFLMPDGRMIVSVGDVSGHGLEAAVIAAKMREAVAVCALTSAAGDPAAVLRCLNTVLRLQYPDVYATAIVTAIDLKAGNMQYACAGHPPPVYASSDREGALRLEYGGFPLGVSEDCDVKTRELTLSGDATLALYTDGLIEFARDIEHAERALLRAVDSAQRTALPDGHASRLVDAVLGGSTPSDDVVVVVVRYFASQRREAAAPIHDSGDRWQFDTSDPAGAHRTRQAVARWANRARMDADTTFRLQIAFGEMVANAVQHAPGLVRVSLQKMRSDAVLTVTDSGPGFNAAAAALPHALFDENGRGLFLIKALSEEVSVTSPPGQGTSVTAKIPLKSSKKSASATGSRTS